MASSQLAPAVGINKVQNENPSLPETQEKPNQGVVNWIRTHKITTSIGAIFVFSLGGPLNFFGSNPRIFYFPAIVFCILLCWAVLSGTHKYVQRVVNRTAPTSNVNPSTDLVRGLLFHKKIESVIITMGGLDFTLALNALSRDPSKRTQHVLSLEDTDPIVPYVENGRLFCDIEFFSKFGLPPIKLEHNVLSGKPPRWDWNQNDRAIEVVNEALVPVFQMYWKDDNHVVFNGVFPNKSGVFICTEGSTRMLNDKRIKEKFPTGVIPLNVKRIFKYPSYKFPGKVDESSN